MKKIFLILLCLTTAIVVAAPPGHYGPYDPGAARANLSNVDAAATPSMTSVTLSGKVKAAWADILGDIYASGTAKVSAGTSSAPAYSFASDPNTGIYSPSADNLAVSVAGVEALRVNSAGEMLIATSTDAGDYKLQVSGNIKANYVDSQHNTPVDWTIGTDSAPVNFEKDLLWLKSAFNQGDAGRLATYTQGPLAVTADGAFVGGVLMPNGKVCLVPYNSDYIGIYDPVANTYTQGPLAVTADGAFVGGVLMPNGKVCLVPCNSDYIGIYDPVANTYTQGPLAVTDDGAFFGGVLMPNGKVCLVPYNSDYIGIYDGLFGNVPLSTAIHPFLNKF